MKKQLDIGCGTLPAFKQHGQEGYEHYGVDIIDQKLPNVKQADLAIDPIPYGDDEFDLVTAHEIFEHIPKLIYLQDFDDVTNEPQGYYRWNCLIELFNEVYRVLKDGGILHFDVPYAGTPQFYGDPTHVSEWTVDSVNYYCGDYFGYHDDYGHRSKFKKLQVGMDPERDWRMIVELQAVKPMEPPYEP